jgi:hypothetical protein
VRKSYKILEQAIAILQEAIEEFPGSKDKECQYTRSAFQFVSPKIAAGT